MSIWELIDLEELQSIQDSFALVTNLSSVVMSPEGEPITKFSNPTSFCSLIQSTEEGKRRCQQSFREMGQEVQKTKERKMFFCFVQGGHFVSPIVIDDEHHGTMFAGQFLPQPYDEEQLQKLDIVAREIGLPPERLKEEGIRMRVVDTEVVWNHALLFSNIVTAITRMGSTALVAQKAHLEQEQINLDLQKTNAMLQEQRDLITWQRDTIQALSAPIIRIWDRTIVLPVIGIMDSQRSADIRRRLMKEIRTQKLRYVLIDITGVDVVDTRSAEQLIKIAMGVKLLGAECILTGISPEVAETLSDLGVDLSAVQTQSDVQDGLRVFFRGMRLGFQS